MSERIQGAFKSFRTTLLSGVLFLLPLAALGTLIGQAYQLVLVATRALQGWIPFHTPWGIAVLTVALVGIAIALCFMAGLAAEAALGKFFTDTVERQIVLLFPRYAIFKEQISGHLASDLGKGRMKPVLIKRDGGERLAFETDRSPGGRVAVFLPGCPDPWSGILVYLTADQVKPLSLSFADAMKSLETLGQDAASIVERGLEKDADNSSHQF